MGINRVSIKVRLLLLAVVNLVALTAVLAVIVIGLNSIGTAEEAAQRREGYVRRVLEIKADVLSTVLSDPSQKETQQLLADAEKSIAEESQAVLAVIKRPEIRKQFQDVMALWTRYDGDFQALIKQAQTDPQGASAQTTALYQNDCKPLVEALAKFSEARVKDADKARAEAKATSDKVFVETIGLTALIGILIFVFALAIGRSIGKGIQHILTGLEPLRHGQLNVQIRVEGKDEMSNLALQLNGIMASLRQIVEDARNNSDQVATAAAHIAQMADRVASDSATQSEAASSTAAAIEQLTVSAASIADAAQEVHQQSETSTSEAIRGEQSVRELEHEMAVVKTAVESIATHVRGFLVHTEAITGMTQQVREIADQTNLLALNAAIEAARAGEQGRGFAVVADEVRKLAERSSASAGEITTVTEQLNSESSQVSQSIEHGLASLEASHAFVTKVTEVLRNTNDSIQRAAQGMDGVSTAVQQQKAASAEIARHVETIARMADENREASNESSNNIRELLHLAEELKTNLERFNT